MPKNSYGAPETIRHSVAVNDLNADETNTNAKSCERGENRIDAVFHYNTRVLLLKWFGA